MRASVLTKLAVFCVVVVFALLIGCGDSSSGGGGGGGGTTSKFDVSWYTDNPGEVDFTISTASQLAGLADIVNGTWSGESASDNFDRKTITLAGNIDLSAYTVGEGWVPIGVNGKQFSGTFDGGGNVISKLTINRPDAETQGLFGGLINGNVQNLGLEDVNIKGRRLVGGIAGNISMSGSVTNCYSTGTISGQEYIGGLVGSISNYSSLKNSYSSVVVSGTGSSTGGLVGDITSSDVASCYSIGTVSISSGQNFGGVAGYFGGAGSLTNSVALNLEVKGTSWPIGGRLVGGISIVTSNTPEGMVRRPEGTLSNNAAYVGMINKDGNTAWENKGEHDLDSEDISAAEIRADGTLGGRFTSAGGWTTQNGSLPGLFGRTVAMPGHIQ